jgi:hypothetical protein
MASEEDAILVYESVIRGHHVYKDIWIPMIGEILEVQREPENEHDHRAVCVLKSDTIVGHIPREFSRIFWFFLGRGGRISCEVTGRRKHGKGLEVPCVYTITGREKMIMKMKGMLRAKSGRTSKPHSQ